MVGPNKPPATGFHHLAVMTKDMKSQLEFFTQVVGLPLVAIFDMHGVPGAWHAFVRLGDESGPLLSFCQVPGVEEVPSTIGVTHAGTGAGVSAPGTMQHLAFSVRDLDALLTLRDRLRSHGVVTFGPLDHGMCESIYFAGPEGLVLEAACSDSPLDSDRWVDPSIMAALGIGADDIARYTDPPAYTAPSEPVPQPTVDPAHPRLDYPDDLYEVMVGLSDEQVRASGSHPEPPVPA